MVENYATQAALAQAAAQAVSSALGEALRTRGRASLVATGGRSPGPVYDILAGDPLDWSRVAITFSDERCVDADDPASNQRLLRAHMGAAAALGPVLPLWPAPDDAAVEALQPFDVLLLGMGEDGHIASLIPGAPNLEAGLDPSSGRKTFLVPEGVGKPPLPRISLTLAALLQARLTLILIAGDEKRAVVEEAAADLPVHRLLANQSAPVRILWAPNHER